MKKLLLVAISSISIFCVHAQITFQRTYGGSAAENGNSVRQTSDGGYIVIGTTTSFGSGVRDVLVIKTNDLGDTTWTKRFGGVVDN